MCLTDDYTTEGSDVSPTVLISRRFFMIFIIVALPYKHFNFQVPLWLKILDYELIILRKIYIHIFM